MDRAKGFFSLLITGLIFGSFGIWIRLLSKELTSFQQIAIRNVIGFIFAILIVYLLKQNFNLSRVNKVQLLLFAFCYPLAAVLYVFAILNAKISAVTFVFYAVSYVVTFLISTFYFKDKPTTSKVWGLGLAMLGLLFISYPFTFASLGFGLVYGMLSGLLDSGTNTFRRLVSNKVDRFALVAIQMLAGVLVATVLILISGQPLPAAVSLTSLLISLLFGFLLMSIAFLTLVGFQNFDLGLGTIVMSSELVFAPIFAYIAFKEVPLPNEIIGGLIILMSIVIANIALFKPKTLE